MDRARARLEAHYTARAEQLHISPGTGATESMVQQRQAQRGYVPTPKKKGTLNILWVSANQAQDESGCLQALQRFGTVTVVRQVYPSASISAREAQAENGVAVVLAHVRMSECDVVLGQMWAQWMDLEKLSQIRGAAMGNVSMDDKLPELWEAGSGSVGLHHVLDLVLTTDPNAVLWYAVEGCPATFWPPASDPALFKPASVRDIPLSFIGTKYGVREKIVQAIEDAGFPIQCYGEGWPNGPLDAKRMADVMGRSQIVLGIGYIGHSEHVTTLKLRDFDAPMSGACYLTTYNPELERCYIEGYDIEYYRDIPQLISKLKFLDAHPIHALSICYHARGSAMVRHTWEQRWERALKLLGVLA